MANLISLNVLKDSGIASTGIRAFNTARIKKVQSKSWGSVIYYTDGNDKHSSVYLIHVSQSKSAIDAVLTGSLDIAISVIDSIMGAITLKTADILLVYADPDNASNSYLITNDSIKLPYYLRTSFSTIINNANNYSFNGGGGGIAVVKGSFEQSDLDIDGNLTINLSSAASDFTASLTDNNGVKQIIEGLAQLTSPTTVKLFLSGYEITGTWKYIINFYA
jgi:hypothetical protein